MVNNKQNKRIPAFLKEAAEPSINENVPGMGGIPQSSGGDYGMVRQPYDKDLDDTDKVRSPEPLEEKKWSCLYDEENATWHFYYGEEEVASLPVAEVDKEAYLDGYGNLAEDDLTSEAFGKQMLEQAKAKYKAKHKEETKEEIKDEHAVNEDVGKTHNKIPKPNKAVPNTYPGEGEQTRPVATDGEFSIATGNREIRRSTSMGDKQLYNKVRAMLSNRMQATNVKKKADQDGSAKEDVKQPENTPNATTTETPSTDKEVQAWYAKFVDPDSPNFNPHMAAEFLAANNPMEKCMGPIKNYETTGTSDFDREFSDAEKAKPQKQTETMQQPYEKGTQRAYPKGKDQIGQSGEVIPGGVKMSNKSNFGKVKNQKNVRYPHEASPIKIDRIEKTAIGDEPPMPDPKSDGMPPKMDKPPQDAPSKSKDSPDKGSKKKNVTCPNCGHKFDVDCGSDGRGRPPGVKNKPKPDDGPSKDVPGSLDDDADLKKANAEMDVTDDEVMEILSTFGASKEDLEATFGKDSEEALKMMEEIEAAENDTSLEDQILAAAGDDNSGNADVEAADEFITQAEAMYESSKVDNKRIASDEMRERWINVSANLAQTLATAEEKQLNVERFKEHLSGLSDHDLITQATKIANSYKAYSEGTIESSDEYTDMEAVADLDERTAQNASKNINIFGRVRDHTRPDLP